MGAYLVQQDLDDALGPETIRNIYDDANTGSANPVTVATVIRRAETEVNSYLPNNYERNVLPVVQVPIADTLKMCALDYAICFTWERHSEYARLYQKDCEARMKRADERMKRVVAGVQRLFDLKVQPKPGNVGGVVTDIGPRTIIASTNGTQNSGDF